MRPDRLLLASTACLLLASIAGTGAAQPRVRWPADTGSVLPRSIGSPTDGALIGGVALEEGAGLRLRWPDGPRWALPQLVSLLQRAARRVHGLYPGSVLVVGDLSRREGGALSGHVSHESGRDADVGFYYSDTEGRPVRPERLLPVSATGQVPAAAELRFDEARNWALVETFLTDRRARVQRIFVAEPLKRRLLDFARRRGAPEAVISRAATALRQPGSGPSHDDHFHVRIACPPGSDPLCVPHPGAEAVAAHGRTAALERGR